MPNLLKEHRAAKGDFAGKCIPKCSLGTRNRKDGMKKEAYGNDDDLSSKKDLAGRSIRGSIRSK